MAFAAAAGALAQAEPTPESTPPGLAAAKSDYEAIKASGDSQRQQNLTTPALPVIDLPPQELRLLPGASAPEWLQRQMKERARARPTAQSPTWLLDAMGVQPTGAPKPVDARAGAATPETAAEGEATTAGSGDFLAHARQLQREAEQRDRTQVAERALTAATRESPNPLAGFMAGWMTPHDYELLAAKPEPGPARFEPLSGTSPTANGTASPLSAGGRDESMAGAPAPGAAAPANPYLAELTNAFAPTPHEPAQLSLPTQPEEPRVLRPEPPPAPRAPTAAEEFRKTQNDGKYFKQLKRF